jgi:Transglutaminase-like superfamily
MGQFECHLEEPVPSAGDYLFPVPINTSEQKITQITLDGVEPTDTISSLDGAASANRFALKKGDLPFVRIAFEDPGPGLSDGHFKPRETRFDRPSQALLVQISSQFTQMDLPTRVPHIIQFIADHFQYGQRDIALGDDEAAMPALECGLTFGTCVDMHTVAVAALRAIGIEAAYVMGGSCRYFKAKLSHRTLLD